MNPSGTASPVVPGHSSRCISLHHYTAYPVVVRCGLRRGVLPPASPFHLLVPLVCVRLTRPATATSSCASAPVFCAASQALLAKPTRLYCLVLAPTRELAFGISEQFEALGASIDLTTAVIVGGVDMVTQAIALARKPHVVIGTPGRIVDHLENTKVCA